MKKEETCRERRRKEENHKQKTTRKILARSSIDELRSSCSMSHVQFENV